MFIKIISFFYGAATAVNLFLYKKGIRIARKFSGRVISVGNISSGGCGKTPFTIELCRILNDDGRRGKAAVITRGYKGRAAGPERVQIGPEAVERFGDEAVMAARILGDIPVIVSKKRADGIDYAGKKFGCGTFILDDAFQNFSVIKDFEIVLVDALNPWGGLMRESKRSLTRADIIIIARSNQIEEKKVSVLERGLARYSAQVFRAEMQLLDIRKVGTNERVSKEFFNGRRCAALCAIGNPESFKKLLKTENIALEKFMIFNDHHLFNKSDIEKLDNDVLYLVTAKDDVKLEKYSALRSFYRVNIKFEFNHDGIKNILLPARS